MHSALFTLASHMQYDEVDYAMRHGLQRGAASFDDAILQALSAVAGGLDMKDLAGVGQLAHVPPPTIVMLAGGTDKDPCAPLRVLHWTFRPPACAVPHLLCTSVRKPFWLAIRPGVAAVRQSPLTFVCFIVPVGRAAHSNSIQLRAGVVDPSRAKGKWVLSDTEAMLLGASQHITAADVFRLWAEHARTMIQACQRRGESDGTVDWMYQHAALSPETADVPGW